MEPMGRAIETGGGGACGSWEPGVLGNGGLEVGSFPTLWVFLGDPYPKAL